MPKNIKSHKNTTDPGWGELIEDAIGVNLKGLKTLRASLLFPARLFTVARISDWQDRTYSPTLRVWLFLIAILMFLQFIWASPDSWFGQALGSSFAELMPDEPIMHSAETVELALQRYVFVYPGVLLALSFCAALLIRIWSKTTSSVTRIRLFFASILPGALIALLTSLAFALVPAENMSVFSMSVLSSIFLADFFTTWRGLVPVHKTGARTWRALLLAVTNQIVYVVASLISAIIMMEWISTELSI